MHFLEAIHAWTKCIVKRWTFDHQGMVTYKFKFDSLSSHSKSKIHNK